MHRLGQPIALLILILAGSTVHAQGAGPDTRTRNLIDQLGLEESGPALRDTDWWHKPERVYINFSAYGSGDEELNEFRRGAREVAGDVEIVEVGRRLDEEVVNNAEVIVGRCDLDVLAKAPKLRWFQQSAHGADDCLDDVTRQKDFILTNAQHTSGPPIAEHVIAMMMAMARGFPWFHSAQLKHEWRRQSVDWPMIEIGGKTMLIAGLGGIGTEVGERAHALGMTVIATRNSSREGPDFVEYVGLSHEIYDLAKRADVVVNTLPLTDDTRELFNKKFFDAVKPGAYYITTGRGETTNTDDLLAALQDGRLTAAGLDVTDPEPLPPGHPLWDQPNVIITPHSAADTDQGRWRRWLVVRENLRRYINGERMLNVVNKQLGY